MSAAEVLERKHPRSADVRRVIKSLQALPRGRRAGCETFVAEASTAVVYKACKHGTDGTCLGECFAVKIPLSHAEFDESEARVHDYILSRLRGTEAEAHFNRIYNVLPMPDNGGKLIVLRYEHPWSADASTLSDLLVRFDMTERAWKSINFQLLAALSVAQARVAGFSHNDTHTGNLLVIRNVDDHVCAATAASGARLTNHSNLLIRIIDFGQAMTAKTDEQTRDGRSFWGPRGLNLAGNRMIDFHRFVVWALHDIGYAAQRQKAEGVRSKFPPWFLDWRRFLARWLRPEMLVDMGEGAPYQEWIDESQVFTPRPAGITYLNEFYGTATGFDLSALLDDPYFAEFRVQQLKFSKEAQRRR